jgi:mono/diheme cytochrome c family protein
MGTLAFVLLWVLLAGGLLFLGLSGGPGKARARLRGQSRRGRKNSVLAFAVVLIAFGVAVPALVIAAARQPSESPTSGVTNLTAHEERGREVFGQQCRICHSLAAAGAMATVGPDLDKLRPGKELVLDAIKRGRAQGNGAMAADLVTGSDAEAVAAFVAKAVGKSK